MKTPNYDNTVGKHPIPHAKGIAKDEDISKDVNKKDENENEKNEEGKKNK